MLQRFARHTNSNAFTKLPVSSRLFPRGTAQELYQTREAGDKFQWKRESNENRGKEISPILGSR